MVEPWDWSRTVSLPCTRRVLGLMSFQGGNGPCCGSRTRLASVEGWDLTDRPSTEVTELCFQACPWRDHRQGQGQGLIP